MIISPKFYILIQRIVLI